MKRLPVTGSNQLLDLLDPYIPDNLINNLCLVRPVRGPRWQFHAAQLWRTHLLALLTPVHSFNLLTQLLPEQRAWRDFWMERLPRLLGPLPRSNVFAVASAASPTVRDEGSLPPPGSENRPLLLLQ